MHADASLESIAARICALLGGHDRKTIEAAARRLGISDAALRRSTDDSEPSPSVDVLFAIVRHYGVDPTWLVTGDYDPSTHRAAVRDGLTRPTRIADLIAKQLSGVQRAG